MTKRIAPLRLTLLLLAGTWFVPSSVAAGFDQTHALLTGVLTEYVKDGRVNYVGLKARPQELNEYLDQLAAVPRADFNTWTEPQQIAFLTNAYNAHTLKLIIDHFPIKGIRDIGNLLRGPWSQPVVRLFGGTITLNVLEHKMLRVDYNEPRLHFALVCAAKSCPPLRREAYVGARLDEQLDDQGRTFLSQSEKNRVDADQRIVYLSRIFKWYGKDFEKNSGSVLAGLKAYWPETAAAALAEGQFTIRYTRYDWSLND